MKHNYKKPAIIIRKFETSDVIATSCTCPTDGNHHHYINGCYYVGHTTEKTKYTEYSTFNKYSRTGCCFEHGDYWVYDDSTKESHDA